MQSLWDLSLTPEKINLGVANFGRGYTVADTSCMRYDCEFTGPSKPGSCTNLEGALSSCEISRIIQEKKLTPKIMDGGANIKQISWDDQWIGFDDFETLGTKLGLANYRCLGGTALWSIDYQICDGR